MSSANRIDIEGQLKKFKDRTGVTDDKVALNCLHSCDWDSDGAVAQFLMTKTSNLRISTSARVNNGGPFQDGASSRDPISSSSSDADMPIRLPSKTQTNTTSNSFDEEQWNIPLNSSVQDKNRQHGQRSTVQCQYTNNLATPTSGSSPTNYPIPKNRSSGEVGASSSSNSPQMVEEDARTLQNVLDLPISELNILILGETGVGKSTWINGFRNYLSYSSLSHAENGELFTLIPTEFTVIDENFATIQVRTGHDQNELLFAGQSATQTTQVYEFDIGKTRIRLIDTPGIGDTRGIDQDKKNFENILSTLSYLTEIHGICILLKPNNARLTVMFRFCIKELLTYLHRDASHNILFCFTNSRGTFYRPGDTMPALINLLKENQQVQIDVTPNNVYCFDSEAYRFLAAIKNEQPVNFPEEEKENFARSWEKSIKETKRMLEHISKLKPHAIQSTLSLNTARELVLKLVRPLAEVGRNIQINKKIVEDQTQEIASTKADRDMLQSRLMTNTVELVITRINHPKTVCSNTKCKKIHSCGGGQSTVEYTQVCHAHCYLTGVAADTIGDAGLMNCAAMCGKNFCQHKACGHSYREHLHVYYESSHVTKQVEDQTVKTALAKHLSDAETKQLVIDAKLKLISEFEQELKEIEKASVNFAYFLKVNAITPYNDAMQQYLEHLIREENDKVAQGGSRHVMDALILSKDSYLHEKIILEQAMNSASGVTKISPEEINKWVNGLKKLKHSGEALEKALNCIEYAKARSLEGSIIKKPGSSVTQVHPSHSTTSKRGVINGLLNMFK